MGRWAVDHEEVAPWVPPRRTQLLRPMGASVVVGRRGLSAEAAELFALAQRQEHGLSLVQMGMVNPADLRVLAEELVHLGLAELRLGRVRAGRRDPDVLVIPEAQRTVILVDGGWRRWESGFRS